MTYLIVIGIVCCGFVLWEMRQDAKKLRYRGYREITGYDWWKVKRK